MWKVTPLVSEWLSSPSNPLFTSGLLSSQSAVLELGCGVSGLVGLALAPRVGHVVLTDQAYVGKLVERNVVENMAAVRPSHAAKEKKGPAKGANKRRRHDGPGVALAPDMNVRFVPLDWETDIITPALLLAEAGGSNRESKSGSGRFFDAVITSDCVYNDALISPLTSTCADGCRLKEDYYTRGDEEMGQVPPSAPKATVAQSGGRGPSEGQSCAVLAYEDFTQYQDSRRSSVADESRDYPHTIGSRADGVTPCACVVAQQLRHADVFAAWMVHFLADFRAWRVPDNLLPTGLHSARGFVIHIGVPRQQAQH